MNINTQTRSPQTRPFQDLYPDPSTHNSEEEDSEEEEEEARDQPFGSVLEAALRHFDGAAAFASHRRREVLPLAPLPNALCFVEGLGIWGFGPEKYVGIWIMGVGGGRVC